MNGADPSGAQATGPIGDAPSAGLGLSLPPTPQDGGGTGSLYQYLAVFILLLGFFILLNALSSFEEARVGKVMESVEDAFARAADPAGSATDRAREAVLAEAVRSVRDMGDLLAAELPLAKVDASGSGDTLTLTLPVAELFGEDGKPREDRVGLMNRVARVLEPRDAGVQVTLEALLPVGTGTGETDAMTLAAGAFARRLTHTGAPGAALTVGLAPAQDGLVRLLFTITADRVPVRLTPAAGGEGTR